MPELSNIRCQNHIEREAAAICMKCQNYFCKECITEYDDKMLCKNCIDDLLKKNKTTHRKKINLKQFFAIITTTLFLWIIFYSSGKFLISISGFLSSK